MYFEEEVMNKHLIDETIYNVIEKSKTSNIELWEAMFNKFEVPPFFFNEVKSILNTELKSRHIKYIHNRINHIIDGCIDDVTDF
mgnify:CR=1 FL=1